MNKLKLLLLSLMLLAIPAKMLAQDTVVTPKPTARYLVILWFESDSTHLYRVTDSLKFTRTSHDGTIFVFTGPPGKLSPLKTIMRPRDTSGNPITEYAEYDETVILNEIGDDDVSSVPLETGALPWGITYVRAPQVWAAGNTGQGVTVGIMDSGIKDQPGLNVVGGQNFTSDGTPLNNWSDTLSVCNGHGTHVAGTVGSDLYGVAPGANVFAMRVFQIINGSCSAWSSSQIGAVNYARDNGIRIVNASIGGSSGAGSYSITMRNYVRDVGGLMAAAAGNSGGSTLLYPAGYTFATAVAALASSGGSRASYSNRGPGLDVAAPGSGVVSLSKSGTGSVTKSGTSMASPHVAGAYALLLSRQPSLNAYSAQYVLEITARDAGTTGRDVSYGWGNIDVFAADSFLIANPNFVAPGPIFEKDTVFFSSATPDSTPAGLSYDTLGVETYSDYWDYSSPQFGEGVNMFRVLTGDSKVYIEIRWDYIRTRGWVLPKSWTIIPVIN